MYYLLRIISLTNEIFRLRFCSTITSPVLVRFFPNGFAIDLGIISPATPQANSFAISVPLLMSLYFAWAPTFHAVEI